MANAYAVGHEKLRGHLAMMTFAFLIAGSFSFGGLAAAALPSPAINTLRYAASIVFMAMLQRFHFRHTFAFPKRAWRFAILGGLMAIYMYTMFKALEFTKPVATGAVFTLMPLISAGFGLVFLGQKPRLTVLSSLVLAAIGAIWVIFRGDVNAILHFNVGKGELIYFAGVICHGAYAPLIRKFNEGEDPFTFSFWTVLATGAWLMLPGLPVLVRTDLLAVPATAWASILYLAIVTTTITFLLLQYASMRLPASKVMSYGYLTPTFIILLEGALGHGWPSEAVLAGAAVTACGLLLIALLPD